MRGLFPLPHQHTFIMRNVCVLLLLFNDSFKTIKNNLYTKNVTLIIDQNMATMMAVGELKRKGFFSIHSNGGGPSETI